MVRNPCIAGALYLLAALSPYLVATSSPAATHAKSKNSAPRAQHEVVRTDLNPRSKTDCFAVAKTLNERAKTHPSETSRLFRESLCALQRTWFVRATRRISIRRGSALSG